MSFKNLKLDNLAVLIILLGLLVRFYYQFIDWTFNGDEIDLGKEILNSDFSHLFYPFKNKQSAPPLFLFIEKIFSLFAKPYISFKLLTFFSSCISLLLFTKLTYKKYPVPIYLLLLGIFAFNPFIVYNSLTLKQYSIDLMMGLFAVTYFVKFNKPLKTYLFFTFWCFMSNVGLLFSAGFILYLGFQKFILNLPTEKKPIQPYLKKSAPFLLAPILYLAYFAWFMQQNGALAMKSFMVKYWKDSFLPLNFGIFKWVLLQGKAIYFFFFSSYTVIGIGMLILFSIGLFSFIKNVKYHYSEKIKIIGIYLFTILIHLLLSSIKMYPFSDRLYLYIVPIILILFAEGLNFFLLKTGGSKILLTSVLAMLIAFSYISDFPTNENNVRQLSSYIENNQINPSKLYLTKKAKGTVKEWANFTQYNSEGLSKMKRIPVVDTTYLKKNDLIISRQYHKMGHLGKTGGPEENIKNLFAQNKIKKEKEFNGYIIYKVN